MNPNIVSILAEATSWPDVAGLFVMMAFWAFVMWTSDR